MALPSREANLGAGGSPRKGWTAEHRLGQSYSGRATHGVRVQARVLGLRALATCRLAERNDLPSGQSEGPQGTYVSDLPAGPSCFSLPFVPGSLGDRSPLVG